ncbi:unnamed protein product [Staurois parvus]|uniref:Secreted protein n=1 Tax=Staurois parvus TaxID=386267 RepID=A0ABN9HRB2_9NEOB|nr:unnamed protein product [Staurois parvus]
MGPRNRLLMLLPGPQCLMGSLTASHCCCLQSPHSAMCHFQVSSHCLVGSHFVIGVAVRTSHCCCLHRHTLPCATFRSPHNSCWFHFVIECWHITGSLIAAAGP